MELGITSSGSKSVVRDRSNPKDSVQPAAEIGNMTPGIKSVVRDRSNLGDSVQLAVELGNTTSGAKSVVEGTFSFVEDQAKLAVAGVI